MVKLKNLDGYEFYFSFKAGATWDPLLEEYCVKHNYSYVFAEAQELDLIVWVRFQGDLIKTFIFELKDTDLLASLYPKDTSTSLERELKGDSVLQHPGYINTIADYLYLIYVEKDYNLKDRVFFNSFMDKYPTIRRKSYLTQQKAVKGIGKIVKNMGEPLELGYPCYVQNSIPSSLAKQQQVLFGISAEKAVQLAELFENKPSVFYMMAMTYPLNFLDKLRLVWPDSKTSQDYHATVNKIYEYYNDDIEPKINLMSEPTDSTFLAAPIQQSKYPKKQTRRAK